ncbi:hypothetical protein ES332_D03G044200v1 [Gossypium tomentosum]|uniref:Uncharacterized protein n=1 Tax=Gossypium tomentosum TaxID=34277 RepID=A0A5D2LKR8_GOSTO|nr:hypothetical protein ES332_D03G044200v1 [Gossypium tomentosum]
MKLFTVVKDEQVVSHYGGEELFGQPWWGVVFFAISVKEGKPWAVRLLMW